MANFVDCDAFNGERSEHCCDNCVYSWFNPPRAQTEDAEYHAVPKFTRCGISIDVSICYEDTEAGHAQRLAQQKPTARRGCLRRKDQTS